MNKKTKNRRKELSIEDVINLIPVVNPLLMDLLIRPSIFSDYPNFRPFHDFDETAIRKFRTYKPDETNRPILASLDLADLYEDYKKNRLLLNDYHNEIGHSAFKKKFMQAAAQELGNFDHYDGKPVLQNEAETNIFYDYIVLYRTTNGRHYVHDWIEKHPETLNAHNQKVALAFNNARFAVLRLDKNLTNGAIHVVDLISEKSYLLIDKALNASKKEGMFFACSLLDMGLYVMTSGGGVCVDGNADGGKAVLTMTAKHMESFRSSKPEEGVKEIYGYCLCNGALAHFTSNHVY